VKSHHDLQVWQAAVDFAVKVYRATEAMPKSELYGLTGQVRRAALSIGCNIAEGSGRRSTKDLLHFLDMACGSLREVETCLIVIQRLGMLDSIDDLLADRDKISAMLMRLIQSLERKLASPPNHSTT
jgi:four helix bundle protein